MNEFIANSDDKEIPEEKRQKVVEEAVSSAIKDFDLKKLDALRSDFAGGNFDYDGNPILNELLQDVKSKLIEKNNLPNGIESNSHSLEEFHNIDEIYQDIDFKSNILTSLKEE